MKVKADNSLGREKYELNQAYKLYTDYAFPNDKTRPPGCKNAVDSVLCSPNNDECQLYNWKCLLWKCTACTYISLPVVERDSSNRETTIMFNTYMTQFTCSHHVILILGKITTYLYAKGTSKKTCLLCEQ